MTVMTVNPGTARASHDDAAASVIADVLSPTLRRLGKHRYASAKMFSVITLAVVHQARKYSGSTLAFRDAWIAAASDHAEKIKDAWDKFIGSAANERFWKQVLKWADSDAAAAHSALIPTREVLRIAGFSRWTLHRRISKGKFPKPVAGDMHHPRWKRIAVEGLLNGTTDAGLELP